MVNEEKINWNRLVFIIVQEVGIGGGDIRGAFHITLHTKINNKRRIVLIFFKVCEVWTTLVLKHFHVGKKCAWGAVNVYFWRSQKCVSNL